MVPDTSTSTTDSSIAADDDSIAADDGSSAVGSSTVDDGSSAAGSSIADGSSSTLVNALIGGVAGIVLSFVPLSTLVGGAIAGYLEGPRTDEGLKVGAIAGLVMLVPFVLFGFGVLVFGLGVGAPIAFGLMGIAILFASALYTVGLGALGGYLGSYIKKETEG